MSKADKLIESFFPYAETTGCVTVRVAVNFLPEQSQSETQSEPGRWFWIYHVRIENKCNLSIQLLTRYWQIFDGNGICSEVKGEGVIGEQPVIVPGRAFDYVSGCPLATPQGAMEGSYAMVDADQQYFTVSIPRFPLIAPTSVL